MYTEKQTEEWLQLESRELCHPDGDTFEHTAFKLAWEAFDSLILLGGQTHEKLVGYALEEVELQNISFDKAFQCVVAYGDGELRNAFGIK